MDGRPVPDWTRRPRAKDVERTRARELRLQGWTYAQIAAELGVSRSSCSLWLRDLPAPDPIAGRFTSERAYAMWQGRWRDRQRIRRQEKVSQTYMAARRIDRIGDRELLIAGAILYWAEGSKSKPWRRQERVVFVNSDPDLVELFLAWLRLLGVTGERLVPRVQIHESADVGAAVEYWARVTGIPAEEFRRATLKRHNPKTVRKNVGDTYPGCLIIQVRRSAELYREIHGWVVGIVRAVLDGDAWGGTVAPVPAVEVARLRAHVAGGPRWCKRQHP